MASKQIKFEDIKGMVFTEIVEDKNSEEIIFTEESGRKFKMYHDQLCCESVGIEDINEDLEKLIGEKILFAYESTQKTESNPYDSSSSGMWTFYRIGTNKDTVVIRWYGIDNYYSVSVNFEEVID